MASTSAAASRFLPYISSCFHYFWWWAVDAFWWWYYMEPWIKLSPFLLRLLFIMVFIIAIVTPTKADAFTVLIDIWPVLWFEWEMSLIGSCAWPLRPQFTLRYGKVIKPLGCGNLLKEVHHCGWGLRFYSLIHFLFSLIPVCGWDVVTLLADCLAFSLMVDSACSGTVSQNKPWFSSLSFCDGIWSRPQESSYCNQLSSPSVYSTPYHSFPLSSSLTKSLLTL